MKKYGLLGKTLGHSVSNIIHNYVFEKMLIDAKYELIECEIEKLEYYIEALKEGKFHGFNVTIPYKKEIMKYLDYIDDKAKSIGSVNTIYLNHGKVYGTNTDYDGFLGTLNLYNIDVKDKDCYVLGTGGASLAVSKVLTDLLGNVIFVSRTPKLGNISYDQLKDRNIDVLINTTPVGMYPNIDDMPVDVDIISRCDVVIDIIANPKQTKLLQCANSRINGLYMLILQALKAEEIWQEREINLNIEEIVQLLSK